MSQRNLPFKVGQEVEVRSFKSGCRGAWFQCEITNTRTEENGEVKHELRSSHDPDQIYWTLLHKKSPADKRSYLMERPTFPRVYYKSKSKSKIPDISEISEVIAIVDDTWEVGDLVDWWSEDESCFWSATITHILDKHTVEIELTKPPMGEGGSYDASCMELRPSLEWSPDDGWTVPINKETCRRCVRLVHPKREVDQSIIQSSQTLNSKDKMVHVDNTPLPPDDPFEFSGWSSILNTVDPNICSSSHMFDDLAFSMWEWNDLKYSTEENLHKRVLSEFDPKIIEIIESLEDVAHDGHCGYRCCAEMLGMCKENGWKDIRMLMLSELRSDINLHMNHLGGKKGYEEVEKSLDYFASSCSQDYWMRFPDMGFLFATTFNCVLTVLSPSEYVTYLPLRDSPPEEGKIITLVLHNKNHFVKAFLKTDAPIPEVSPGWGDICDPAASEWEPLVSAKFDEWKSRIGYPSIGFSSDHNMQKNI